MRYLPENISAEYGVNIYFDNKEDEIQHIQYNAVVQYGGKYGDNHTVFHLYKKDVVLNRNLADDNSYQLAVACGKAFYPITVLVDDSGLIAAFKTDSAWENWERNKDSLKYFTGEEAERYIADTENALKNEEKLKLLIERDMFFSHFFKLIFGYPDTDDGIGFETNIPLIPFEAPQTFDCVQRVDIQSLNDSAEEYYRISQAGTLTDSIKVEEITPFRFTDNETNSSAVAGVFTAEYEMDKSSGRIESLKCDHTVKYENQILRETKMEAYFLHEKEVLPFIDKELNKQAPRKKNFLERLF